MSEGKWWHETNGKVWELNWEVFSRKWNQLDDGKDLKYEKIFKNVYDNI